MIQELKERTRFQNKGLNRCYPRFKELIDELRERSLSDTMVSFINQRLDIINRNHDEKELKKEVRKAQYTIIKKLEKEHKIVPKGYYQSMWLALGMTVFGVPMGMAFGAAIGNIAMFGIGLPIGMAIGIAIGSQKDAEAAKNGRQLKFKNA
jgi:zinc transporter ZupT